MILVALAAHGGEIRGVVTDASGAPLVDVQVVAYDQRFNYAIASTTSSGAFTLVGLPDNPYRIRAVPGLDATQHEQWYGGGLSVCESPPVEAGVVEDADIVLPEGAAIHGVLVDPDGMPVDGALVIAARPEGTAQTSTRYAWTDDTGAFAIRGLPPEDGDATTWVLEINHDSLPDQFAGGAYDAEDATVWTPAGASVDAGELSLLRGIDVVGAVNGPDGPVEAGEVHVYSPKQVRTVSIADGGYAVSGLPPGEPLPWVIAAGYAITYYPDEDRPGTRGPATSEGDVAEGLDLTVPYESRLKGIILGEGDLSGITVLAYNDTKTVGVGAQVEADGSFEVTRLHGGDYTLIVYAADEGYTSDYVRDENGDELVFPVPDEAESETFVLQLPLGNSVSGTVSDRYEGTAVYGALVYARDDAAGSTKVAATAYDGSYELRGLPDGEWRLWVEYDAYCAGDPDWVDVYHEDSVGPALSLPVELQGGTHLAWDPLLGPDGDHDDMDDVWEADNGLDPTVDDGDGDLDGDGWTNLEEYLLGTDPAATDAPRRCGCTGGAALLVLPLLLFRRRRGFATP